MVMAMDRRGLREATGTTRLVVRGGAAVTATGVEETAAVVAATMLAALYQPTDCRPLNTTRPTAS